MDSSKTANEVLRVKGSTSASALASVIAYTAYEGNPVTLRAIGAAAVNQSMKAVAIAGGYVGPKGKTLWTRSSFADVEMPDGIVTAMVFFVEAR